ncbi:MAG TPA: VCBS repeat-containing protein, partial [Candidatus Saccharimonadales bacterium]|nr:VCBS repeat-containing protein [Candidatus Saccharimonadales bacterium]
MRAWQTASPTSALFIRLALGPACLALAGCGRPAADSPTPPPSPAQAPWFADITAQSGVAFVHQVALSGHYLFSESIGSGAAVIDFDNDGLMDLYFIHNVSPTHPATNRLFRQEAPGHFRDVTAGSGLDIAGYGNGLAVGDLNNDGLPELLITEYDRLRLFLNLGGGKFREMAAEAGLTNRQWCVAAACFDYDR